MALGLAGAYRAAGAQNALKEIQDAAFNEQLRQEELQQREFENELKRRADTRAEDEFNRVRIPLTNLQLATGEQNRAQGAEKFDWERTEQGQKQTSRGTLTGLNPIAVAANDLGMGEDPFLTDEQRTTRGITGAIRKGLEARATWDAGGRGIATDQENIDTSGALRRIAASDRAYAPVSVMTPTGLGMLNRATGVVTPATDQSGNPIGMPPTADMRNRTAGRAAAQTVMDSIGELSERINTSRGIIATIRGPIERAKAQANLADDMSEYQAVVSGFTPLLARAVGHSGVLTEQDVQSVRAMLPQPEDSKSVRDRKMARIAKIMDSIPQYGAQPGVANSGTQNSTPKPTAEELLKKYGG